MNALNGRVPVQDPIRVPGLTPVAQPVDTFIRAAQPPAPTAAMRLADSLSSLAPALAAYGSVQQAQDKQDMPGKVSRALTGRTAGEQRQILATNPDMQSHMAQTLGQRMLGSATADNTIEQLRTEYQTGGFNREGGNFDKWVNDRIQKDLKSNTDPHFAETYGDRVRAGVASLRGVQDKFRADQQVQNQDQLIYGSVKSALGTAVDKGRSPEQLAADLKQTFATTSTVANRPVQEQQQILLEALKRQAADFGNDPQYAQKYKLIQGVLQAQQTGSDGKPAGSLLDSTTLGGQANDVLRMARKAYDDRQMGENSSTIADIHAKAQNADPSYKTDLQAMQKAHPEWLTAGHAVTMDQTFDTAVKVKAEQQRKAELEAGEQRQKDTIIAQEGVPAVISGNVHALQDRPIVDAQGKPAVYSADDQRRDAIARGQAIIDQRYAGQNSPEASQAKFNDEAKMYSTNGTVNPAWKDQLTAGPIAASTMTAAGGDPPPTLRDAYSLYLNLQAKAPNLVGASIDKKGQLFFETARAAQQYLHLDEKQAFVLATKATSDPNWDRADPTMNRKDQATAAQAALSPWFSSSPSSTWNGDESVAETLEAAAALHKGSGIPWQQAIEQSAATVRGNYQVINGTAVRVADRNVPPDFGDLASRFIDQWSEQHKADLAKLGVSKGDITMQALGTTPNWGLFVKGHPAPLELPGAAFTVGDLYAQQAQLKAAQDARSDAANGTAEEHAQGRRDWRQQQLQIDHDTAGIPLGPL